MCEFICNLVLKIIIVMVEIKLAEVTVILRYQ